MNKEIKRFISVLMIVVLLAVMLLPWISNAELIRAEEEHKLYYRYDISLAPDGKQIKMTTSTWMAFDASALEGMTTTEIEKQFQDGIDYLGGEWYIRYYIVTNKTNNPKPNYYKEVGNTSFTSGSDHSKHDKSVPLSWDDFNNWFIKGTASITKSAASDSVTFKGYDVQHKAYFFTNGDEAGGVFSNLDEYRNGKAWLEYVTDPATVHYRTYKASTGTWSEWEDSKTKSLTFNFSDYSEGDKVQCYTKSGLGIKSTVKEHTFGGGEDETDTTTETETETDDSEFTVKTNAYFYNELGNFTDYAEIDSQTCSEGDSYDIPDLGQPTGSWNGEQYEFIKKGWYNPRGENAFLETDAIDSINWYYANDKNEIIFAVEYKKIHNARYKISFNSNGGGGFMRGTFTGLNGTVEISSGFVAPPGYKEEHTFFVIRDYDNAVLCTDDKWRPVEDVSDTPEIWAQFGMKQDVLTDSKWFAGSVDKNGNVKDYNPPIGGSIEGCDDNFTFYAYWRKDNPEYTIRHYQQNANDNDYTLADTEPSSGEAGTAPSYTPKDYTGFEYVPEKTEAPAIAEDGSTVVKLYYDRNVHAVTLNATEGIVSVELNNSTSTTTVTQEFRYGQTVNISAALAVGYDWTGWTGTEGILSNPICGLNAFTMPDSDVSFTATASPKTFVVSFLGNGGTVSTSEMTVTYDSKNGNTNAVTAVRDLYELGGWYTERNDTGAVPSGEMVFDKYGNAVKGSYWNDNGSSAVWKGLSNLTVYAYWTSKAFTLYFDYNVPDEADASTLTGADIKQKPVIYTMPVSELPSPKLAGYSHDGWYTKKTDGSPVTADTLYETSADSTVYAHWSQARYNITYDYNGGICESSNPDSALYTENVTIYAPKREGYNFAGWNITDMDNCTHLLDGTSSSATSASAVASGKSSAIFSRLRGDTGTVKFTATWESKSYSITYNLDGGTDPGNPDRYTCETEDFTLKYPSKDGYIFTGWTGTDLFGTVKDVTVSKGSFGNREYTAHYDRVRYNINYVLNGGSFGADYPTEALYDTAFNISNPIRGNAYTFAGWDITGMDNCAHTIGTSSSTDASATGIKATSFKNLRNTEGCVTFTARWTAVPYNITYNLNGGTVSGNPTSYTADTPTFTLNNPGKTGYTFTGWTGTGLDTPNYSVVISQGSTGNREYTANFTANSYRIEYNLDGGTAGTYAPDSAVYDSTVTISNPTKPGATFEGWDITGMDGCTHTLGTAATTNSSATGIKATSYKNLRSTDGTVTFTAKWRYVSYNITYDFNGGHGAGGGSYPTSVQTWNEFTVTTPVHDNGFNFLGWTITGMDNGSHRYGGYTSNDSTLEGIRETEYMNLRCSPGTVKFTAAWERPVRQIVFMSDDGEMTGESVQDGWTMRFIRFGDKLFTATNEYGISWGTDVPRADKTGYSFLGYYDSIDGGNQLYTGAYAKNPGLYWDTNGRWIGPSLIIYAQYTPRKYKVYYNLNGGVWADDSTSGEKNVTVTYDSTDYNKYYGESDVYRKGYIFEGWYDAVTGGEKVYDADGKCIGGSYWSTDYVE